jgi:hypothetical protein
MKVIISKYKSLDKNMGTVDFYFDGSFVGKLTGLITKSDKTTVWIDLGRWGIYRYPKKYVEINYEN